MHIDNFMASVKHLMPLPWLYQNITLTNSTQQPDTSKSAASELIFQHSPVPLGASDVTAWCWKTLEENWSFAQNETCALASKTSHHLNPVSIVVITDFTPCYIL